MIYKQIKIGKFIINDNKNKSLILISSPWFFLIKRVSE
jgi:hypothetical protein